MQEKQNQVMRVAEARVYLQRILEQEQTPGADPVDVEEKRRLMDVLRSNGRVENGEAGEYDGPIVRIYFPDEGMCTLRTKCIYFHENRRLDFVSICDIPRMESMDVVESNSILVLRNTKLSCPSFIDFTLIHYFYLINIYIFSVAIFSLTM